MTECTVGFNILLWDNFEHYKSLNKKNTETLSQPTETPTHPFCTWRSGKNPTTPAANSLWSTYPVNYVKKQHCRVQTSRCEHCPALSSNRALIVPVQRGGRCTGSRLCPPVKGSFFSPGLLGFGNTTLGTNSTSHDTSKDS